jgi:hypothetical protein
MPIGVNANGRMELLGLTPPLPGKLTPFHPDNFSRQGA